jgi:hypothetical protein
MTLDNDKMIILNHHKEISKDASRVLKVHMYQGEITSVKTGKGTAQRNCSSLIFI